MTHARFTSDGNAVLIIEGAGSLPASAKLSGTRACATGVVTGDGSGWTATIPLVAARWGGPELPLPTGDYEVEIDGAKLTASIPSTMLGTLRASIAGSALRIDPPIDPVYGSGDGQDALERRYVAQSAPLENAVFFESFYGRNASCNPLAIDRELAARAPGVTRYWSVVDLSVQAPDGAIRVVEGSPEWWRARGASRLIVVNDWLRRRYSRRPGQKVLQTWHGTPLKCLALHRPGFDPRRAAAVIKESRRWDVLLAQNTYSAGILRKAYAFLTRPIWVEGYPRNDALVNDGGAAGDGTVGGGAATRAALGIDAAERVLLYAPTWRDDRSEMVDFVDPGALAAATDSVVLVRGHSRTLQPGKDASGPRVIDVTGFPDTSRLLLAADALITDYSSVMFDFSVTGKPLYFLVPDMEHYRGELRGFYFDLEAHAPGPVVRSQDELVEAVRAGDAAAYAERYAAWREKFNARDDGRAAERVVARLLDGGFIDRT